MAVMVFRRAERQQIRLSHKSGLPLSNQLPDDKPTSTHPTRLPQGPVRKHDESTEDKRARKHAVKEAKVILAHLPSISMKNELMEVKGKHVLWYKTFSGEA